MSLSLRFGLLVIGIMLMAVISVSYLFDRERNRTMEASERERLKLHTERAADVLVHSISRLHSDALFLARTLPPEQLRSALDTPLQRPGAGNRSRPDYRPLEQIFLALAHSRPEYFQLRLIGIDRSGPELVRIERREKHVLTVRPEALQQKGDRYYVQEARELEAGQVRLSRIDLNREQHQISQPETKTLRATTPLKDHSGRVFALIVINMNVETVFERMKQAIPATGQLFVLNQEGDFLHHYDPAKAMGFEHDAAYRLSEGFPAHATTIADLDPNQGFAFNAGSGHPATLAYATNRQINVAPQEQRRITLILTEPLFNAYQEIALARQESYLIITLLVIAASVVALLLSHRWMASLRALATVSHGIIRGDYSIQVPEFPDGELGKLSCAFRHMIQTLKRREEQLQHLNQDLEQQVSARSRELAASQDRLSKEHTLLESILNHVGDGVIAVDKGGRVLLWNRRAQELLGRSADNVSPAQWSQHFGIHRTPKSEHLPLQQHPLIRALRGETVRDQELYIHSPHKTPGCWISVFARPLTTEDGKLMGAVAVLVDSEESHKLAEQREIQSTELARIGRLTLIAQMVDTVAHRLSQPLAAIANYAGAALTLHATGRLDDTQLDDILRQISRQAQRGGEQLDKLRELNRGDHPDRSALDANGLVQSALELLGNQLKRLHIVVEQRLTPDLPSILGCRIELQQALVHLLVNAMESLATTRKQTRRLYLATGCDPAAKRVRIAVGDNGPGIPSESKSQIFDAWTSSKPNTLGLGLAVVRHIVEHHNGQVGVADRQDNLTWFVIEIPIMDMPHAEK
jgi:PAS domain S-box-containing protein